MNYKVLISLLPFIMASAQASEICTDEQRSINAQNTYIMTDDILFGPVKSMQATHEMPENKDGKSDNGTKIIKFSDCGKLISYHWSAKRVVSASDSVIYFIDGELTGHNPYHITFASGFEAPSNTSHDSGGYFYSIDNNGKIIKQQEDITTISKYYSDEDENNVRSELSTNSDKKLSTSIVNWKDGLIDTVTGETYGAKISFQYNYNSLKQLVSVIDTETNKPMDMYLTNKKYSYDANGFIDKATVELLEKGKIENTTVTECLEKDPHGNCLTEIMTGTRSGFKSTQLRKTKYIYEYY